MTNRVEELEIYLQENNLGIYHQLHKRDGYTLGDHIDLSSVPPDILEQFFIEARTIARHNREGYPNATFFNGDVNPRKNKFDLDQKVEPRLEWIITNFLTSYWFLKNEEELP